MCRFETHWDSDEFGKEQQELIFEKLQEPLKDGLIVLNDNSVTVLPQGRPFIRNICMAFDLYLHRQNPKERIFSMTV
jgi:oxygen-independent coproporphyrinogen-3 oxidase